MSVETRCALNPINRLLQLGGQENKVWRDRHLSGKKVGTVASSIEFRIRRYSIV